MSYRVEELMIDGHTDTDTRCRQCHCLKAKTGIGWRKLLKQILILRKCHFNMHLYIVSASCSILCDHFIWHHMFPLITLMNDTIHCSWTIILGVFPHLHIYFYPGTLIEYSLNTGQYLKNAQLCAYMSQWAQTSHYLTQWRLVYRRIYASLGFNELKQHITHP